MATFAIFLNLPSPLAQSRNNSLICIGKAFPTIIQTLLPPNEQDSEHFIDGFLFLDVDR